MNTRNQRSKASGQNRATRCFALFALVGSSFALHASDFASLRDDRAAVERVYYNHRLGEKPPFEQVLPPATLENLVRLDLRKDAVLQKTYRVEVTPALLAAKTNGADSEKLLTLLKFSHSSSTTETTWQLGPRPAETNAPDDDEIQIKRRFGPSAQLLSAPRAAAGQERKSYFADLPGELQNVLRVQLRQTGSVSAVIEMPGGFLLYVAKGRTADELSVAILSIPKRSYEQWLNEANENKL